MRKAENKEYIQNLIRSLDNKNRYFDLFGRVDGEEKFIDSVKLDLEIGDVRVMKPETLGKIMGAFAADDVMATKEQIFNRVHFCGDCEEFLREIVCTCLAFAIYEYLIGVEARTILKPFLEATAKERLSLK
jgi:hypothetical protein